MEPMYLLVALGAIVAGFVKGLSGIVAPAMLVPTLLGAKLYIGISEARFRQIVLGLLTASGMALLASSLPILPSRGAAG